MEEDLKKKNNKGLVIVIILVLVICLGFAAFFMYKMLTYNDTSNTSTESKNNQETTDELIFTELNKYNINEGEEKKHIDKNGNEFVFKYENKKTYFNNIEIGDSYTTIYVTNYIILFSKSGQNGEIYNIYDLNGNFLYKTIENYYYWNLRVEKGNLLVDGADTSNYNLEYGSFTIDNLSVWPCDLNLNTKEKNKKVSEYLEIVNLHKNDALESTYNITFKNNIINFEEYKINLTVGQELEKGDYCAEKNS